MDKGNTNTNAMIDKATREAVMAGTGLSDTTSVLKSLETFVAADESFFQHFSRVLTQILRKDISDGLKRKAIKGVFRVFRIRQDLPDPARKVLLKPIVSLTRAFTFRLTPEGHRFWYNFEDTHPDLRGEFYSFVLVEALVMLSDLTHRERQKTLRELRRLAKIQKTLNTRNGLLGTFFWQDSNLSISFWQDIAWKIYRSEICEGLQ